AFPKEPGEVGVLGETFDQDRAGPVQGCLGVGDAFVGVGVCGCGFLRILGGIGQQPLGQGFEAGFAGDLGLGAAFGFVREVDVFQTGLGVGLVDAGLQGIVQLALGTDRFQDRVSALVQFPQVAQALFEGTQL